MSADTPAAAPAMHPLAVRRKRRFWPTRLERKQLALASIFIGPWLIGLFGFVLYPMAFTVYLSFTKFGGIKDPVWIGLANYERFWTDPNFGKALYVTLYYTLLAVPIGLVVAIVLALAMNTDLPEIPVYRVILFLPSVLPLFAISFIFKVMLDPNKGIVNEMLRNIGLNPPNWFGNPDYARIGLVILAQFSAGQVALVFLAGLKGIPAHLYEAAMMDGAGMFNRFFKITLPLLTPVILYDLILGISLGLQVFTQAYIITDGGPAKSTTFLVFYLYQNAFKFSQMGFASAIGVFLFVLTFGLAALIFTTSKRWVHYELN
jgi:multiple sugar transport system permease protein